MCLKVPRGGADGGVDLRLAKGGQTTLVQCKQWKAYKVSVKTVRELFGVMMAEQASRCILVTSGVYTADAKQWADGKAIELIDGAGLTQLIGHLQPAPPPAPKAETVPAAATAAANHSCPKCTKPMVLRTARKGAHAGSQFWGCTSYPACRGTVAVSG